jgi:hypothetical protein
MSSRLLRRPLLILVSLMIVLPAVPARASAIDFEIFDTNTLLILGAFTVDPTLASPTGTSSVEVSAFSMTETFTDYGTVTVTLDDIVSVLKPHARFVDGQINAISSNTQYELPGGIAVNVDIVPELAPSDLNFVAVSQMWAATLPNLTNMRVGPTRGVGIREATVPEPSTMLLMGLGAGVLATIRRRRNRKVA